MSDNLNMLRQMLPKSSSYDISVKASSGYHLNEKEEPLECKMITSLDDIRKYAEHSEYTLVYNGYDLSHLFYLRKQAGYEPQVRFSEGCVSELNFKFKIKINSKSGNTTGDAEGIGRVEAACTSIGHRDEGSFVRLEYH